MAIAMHAPAEPKRDREIDRATLVRCKSGDPLAFRAFVVRKVDSSQPMGPVTCF